MAGELPDLGGGTWATILTALGVGGAAAYKAFRKVKEDVGGDRRVAESDGAISSIIKHMREEIDRLTTEVKDMALKLDKVAHERNEALATAAKAQAEALVLVGKVENLETDVKELREELAIAETKLADRDSGVRRRASDYHLDYSQGKDQDRREI